MFELLNSLNVLEPCRVPCRSSRWTADVTQVADSGHNPPSKRRSRSTSWSRRCFAVESTHLVEHFGRGAEDEIAGVCRIMRRECVYIGGNKWDHSTGLEHVPQEDISIYVKESSCRIIYKVHQIKDTFLAISFNTLYEL